MKISLNLLFIYIKIDSIFVVYYMLAYYSVIDHCFHKNRDTDEFILRNILELFFIGTIFNHHITSISK